uniref:Uncharacterized protein n=1 Tax=Raphanus sativus TaxID=3726 RepID=R4I1U2_RAPSA|nr:hypothetical protein RasatMp047 [Raphanus sativus]AIE42597.1 hypothetical protein RadishMT_p067 [Raphanus sativus]QGW48386.1 hypothetical protein [Raphanus sativus]QGW48622.1 hypothetical protein [Raphanus sativus]
MLAASLRHSNYVPPIYSHFVPAGRISVSQKRIASIKIALSEVLLQAAKLLLEEDKMRILSIAYQLLILSVDYYFLDPLLNRRDFTYFHSLPYRRSGKLASYKKGLLLVP